jgi:hypothetical protein
MAAPRIPVDVDEITGWWTVDSLPMILVPQHFLVNNHKAVEAALGVDAYRALLDPAGHRSAWHWCEHEAAHHGLAPEDTVRHYLKRLSQRGWGQFAITELDAAAGHARVRLEHSVFVNQYGHDAGRKVDYMFCGWLEGAVEYAGTQLGWRQRVHASEVQCAAEGAPHCEFEVVPR